MADSVVIVTGGGRGIGRAIARRFAKAGAQVIAGSRNVDDLEETRKGIEADGGRCLGVPTDVCSADDVSALIETAVKRFGRVDVLVNNAGVAPLCKLEELDPDVFRALMSVNVDAVYLGCRAVWPVMRKQGGGAIVNMSSIASADPFPGFAAYGASKAWINAWTKSLAEEGRAFGIRVYAVAPGAVETRMLRDVFPGFPSDQALDPRDVANMVFTLTQPECVHATGATVFVRK